MPGIKEIRLDTVTRVDKYQKDQIVIRYNKKYRITRIIQEMHNNRPTGYYIVLGTEV